MRFTGRVVRASDPPPARWTIHVAKKDHTRSQGGWFVLDVDGHEVRVECGGAELDGEPSVVEDGGFRDLRARSTDQFPADLAAPFAEARLTLLAIQPGDEVAVEGEVVETRLDGDGDYRAAPTALPRRIRSSVVQRGKGGEQRLERVVADRRASEEAVRAAAEPPPPREPRDTAWQWIAIGAAVAAALVLADRAHVVSHLALCAPAAVAAGLILASGSAPEFRVGAGKAEPWDPGLYQFMAFFFYGPAIFVLHGMRIVTMVATIAVLAIAFAMELTRIPSTARFRRIARADAWRGGTSGPVRVAGVVRDPTPVTVGELSVALAREVKGYAGRRISWVSSNELLAKGSFFVDAPEGTVEVSPGELDWATTCEKGLGGDGNRYDDVSYVPVGARAVVVGWVEHGKLVSKGTTPAWFLATGAGGDPLAVARRVVRRRWLALVGLVVCGVLSAVLGLLSG